MNVQYIKGHIRNRYTISHLVGSIISNFLLEYVPSEMRYFWAAILGKSFYGVCIETVRHIGSLPLSQAEEETAQLLLNAAGARQDRQTQERPLAIHPRGAPQGNGQVNIIHL